LCGECPSVTRQYYGETTELSMIRFHDRVAQRLVFSDVKITQKVEMRYDTIEVFNVDSNAECGQLNLAHETKTNANDHLL